MRGSVQTRAPSARRRGDRGDARRRNRGLEVRRPENYDLKHAIAAQHGVTPAHVVVGEGIDALFGVVARLHVEPGVAVVTSLGAYPTFAFHVVGNGGRL